MKTGQEIIAELVVAEPQFVHYLREDVDDWLQDDGAISLCMVFTSLTNFVLADLAGEHRYNYEKIFALVENYIAGGEQALRNAAATCFIENLQNTSGRMDPGLWVPYAGRQTRKFALAWDEFSGLKTQALYD